MGQVSDILTSEEWKSKSPLERASARRDLFQLTVNQNPQLQEALKTAPDTATKQAIFNDWDKDVRTKFPEAFKVTGRFFTQNPDNPGQINTEITQVPIGDLNTEAILEAADPSTEKGRTFAKELLSKGDADSQAKMRLALFQRYGGSGEDSAKVPQELIQQVGARRVGGVYDYPILIPNAIRTAGAVGGSIAGAALGSPTGPGAIVSSSLGGAGGAALVEPIAQATEKALETRKEYGVGEGLLNVAMGGIPVIPIKGGGALLRTAVRAGEGAVQGAGYSAVNQLILDEAPFSWKQVGIGAAAGAGLGGLLGGLEARYAARLAGKSPQAIQEELPKLIADAPTPEAKQQLTNLQRQIEQSLGLDSRELAPATLVGVQEGLPEAGIPDTPLYNLTRDAAGTVQDSTVTRQTLEGAGFRVPEVPADLAPGQRVEIPVADLEPNAARSAEVFQEALDAPAPAAARTELAAQETRAADFTKARFEEAEGVIQANQLAGEEARPVSLPPAEAQITVMQMGDNRAVQVDIPGAPGERPIFSGTPEQAIAAGYDFKLPADLPEGRFTYEQLNPSAYAEQSINSVPSQGSAQPNVETTISGQEVSRGLPEVVQVGSQGDALIDPQVTLSPQAQDMVRMYETTGFDKRGYIDPVLMRSLASGATSLGAGAYGLTQGETQEERLKNGLAFAILGAGGGYMAGRAFTRALQSRPNVTGTPELDAWYKRLSKPADGVELSKKIRDLPNRFRAEATTSMAPLDKLPRMLAEANNTPLKQPELPLSRQFENVSGASGKALVDAQDYQESVLSKISENEWQDFNALLAIKRTGQRLQQDANLVTEQARIQAIPESQRTADEVATLATQPDRRRVAGETLQTVDAALAGLEKKLGGKRFAELDQLAAGPVQQEADKALRVMVASGRMSQEQYAAIKASNDFYAPFRVMQYAEDFDGFPGMKANPVDTTAKYTQAIKGIDSADFQLDDPAKVMMEKIYQARILAEKNMKMKVLADMADEDASGTVVKKLGVNESAPRGMETVNYFDNGVARQLAVPPEVAEAVKGLNPAGTGVISRFVRAVNKPFRFGATAGNIGFQAINAPADLFRQATISKYGIGRGYPLVDTLRYPADFIHALYSSMLSRPSASTAAGAVGGFYAGYQTGEDTPEKFRNAAVGAVLGGAAGRGAQRAVGAGVSALREAGQTGLAEALDPNTLYRQFYQSGAAGSTLQDMLSTAANRMGGADALSQATKGPGVINTLQDFGKAIEETTKLLGFKRGLRIEGIDKLSKQKAYDKLQEVVSETRNFAGSPDFSVAGHLVKDLNAAVVFLNPRIQGLSEDAGRLFGRDGAKPAAAAWTALATAVGLPAAYLWSRNNAPENKADYAQVSPEEKWRNAMIPRYDENGKPLYFTNERGQVVREYYRIPLRDTAQNFYQMVQSSMDFAQSKDPERVSQFAAELTENLSPINIQGKDIRERAESAISSFGPVGTIPYMLATQRIPGLHRDIFADDNIRKASPENQFTATTPQVYKDMAQLAPQWLADPLRSPLMLEQLASAGTGGILSQFTPPRATPGRDQTATNLQQSPLGRRFVRSSYVYDPAPQEAKDVLQGQADQRTTAKRTGTELFMELNVLPPAERAPRIRQLPPEQKDMLRDEIVRRQKRPADEEMALIGQMGVENGTRAKYLFDRVSDLTPQERTVFLKDLQQAKLLSDDVKKQIQFLLQAQQRGAGRTGRN
jgi:hypothetical protein